LQVNYLGTLYPTLAVLPGMYERRRGHIVNVASVAGRMGAPLEAAYCGTKFAVTGLSEALSAETAAYRVAVSLVQPGPVETDFFDARGVPYQRSFPRAVSAEKVAKAVIRAVERGKAETFVPHWLGAANMIKTLAPPLYRMGVPKPPADA
jgi:short-subunit dehydrogenase